MAGATAVMDNSFLSSSHFRVAQENSLSLAGAKSTFKKDYIPWKLTKSSAVTPPRPAEILQKDDRYFNDQVSETFNSFKEKSLPSIEQRGDIYTILRATNFKMDRDLSKFTSYDTSHNSSYPPRGVSHRKSAPGGLMGSSFPQGDPEKAPQPVSSYRDTYRGHPGSSKPDRAVCRHQVGPETITGDERLPQFGTSHRDDFLGIKLPKLDAFPAPRGTNIPEGDKQKEKTNMTTSQESFPRHLLSGKGYDRSAVTGKLQRTNFAEGDGHNTWNDYASNFRDSYKAVPGNFSLRIPSKHRNHSDLPSGDDDSWRSTERANMTTNRYYHGNVFTPRVNIVSGADRRTKSEVHFGDPDQERQDYSTTTDETFQPKSLPQGKAGRPDFNTRSSIPVDYYPNEVHASITYGDFRDPKTGRMYVNSTALDKLKKTNYKAPKDGEHHFSTEHVDQFVPKKTLLETIDPGRLQRSSVPLGTFKKFTDKQ